MSGQMFFLVGELWLCIMLCRGQGAYGRGGVLSVPRQKAAPIPIRQPSEPLLTWGQKDSFVRPPQTRFTSLSMPGLPHSVQLHVVLMTNQLYMRQQARHTARFLQGGLSYWEYNMYGIARLLLGSATVQPAFSNSPLCMLCKSNLTTGPSIWGSFRWPTHLLAAVIFYYVVGVCYSMHS